MTLEWLDKKREEDLSLEREIIDDIESEEDDSQQLTFGYVSELKELWDEHWQDMPEFAQEDETAYQQIIFSFRNKKDVQNFAKLVDQKFTDKTKSAWYPKYDRDKPSNYLYINKKVNTKYPIYIISKGRWDKGTTRKAFEKMGIPYRIVIEPQEYDKYASVIDSKKIMVLPFSNLGQGSIPARNWVWERSRSVGAERHWIFDDNICSFYRLNRNRRLPIADGTMFRAIEDFVDRYENIALAGCQYLSFAPDRQLMPPFYLNTRIYSMILIDNNINYRWRGRYNEDTDLSLRVLKDGLCTVLFNAFLGDKATTMTMSGGNTSEIYVDGDNRLKFAQSLQKQHPDVVTVVKKWGRWHHHVNYEMFKYNKLIKKQDIVIPKGINNYGMILKVIE